MSSRGLPDGSNDLLLDVPYLTMSMQMPVDLVCHYCPAPATTRDHVVAKTNEGSNRFWNLVPACQGCNSRKGDQPPTCACAFCLRAVKLHALGHRTKHFRPFAVKAPKLPVDLSIEAYERGRGFGPTPQHEGLPRSFNGSV